MLTEANVLILDEPTNHLDAVSKKFETGFKEISGNRYCGIHEREFITDVYTYFQYRRSFVIVVFKECFNEQSAYHTSDLS